MAHLLTFGVQPSIEAGRMPISSGMTKPSMIIDLPPYSGNVFYLNRGMRDRWFGNTWGGAASRAIGSPVYWSFKPNA